MSELPQFHKSLEEPQLGQSWDVHKWIHSDKTLHRTCPIWNCPNFLNENEFIIMSPNTPATTSPKLFKKLYDIGFRGGFHLSLNLFMRKRYENQKPRAAQMFPFILYSTTIGGHAYMHVPVLWSNPFSLIHTNTNIPIETKIQGPIPDTKTPTLSKLEIGLGQDSQPKDDLKVLQQGWMTMHRVPFCLNMSRVGVWWKTFMLISCTFLFLHSAKCIDLCCYSGAIMWAGTFAQIQLQLRCCCWLDAGETTFDDV